MRQVIIGSRLDQIKPSLLLDLIQYASYNRIEFALDRFVQIDVDDVFVAKTGARMRVDDVNEMIRFQDLLNRGMFNSSPSMFKFNLGYSGFYFSSGSREENLADELLKGKTIKKIKVGFMNC